jgi:hypothetical protein
LKQWKEQVTTKHPSFNLPTIKTDTLIGTESQAASADLDELKILLSRNTIAQQRAILLLHIQFHYIAIVATRPILLRQISKANKHGGAKDLVMTPESTLCVHHACQLALLFSVLDSLQIVNGLLGLDVFYAYCAAMILILRLLWQRPLPSGEPHSEGLEEEDESAEDVFLRMLISNNTDKSGSMKRFAKVVDTFASCTSHAGRRKLDVSHQQNSLSRPSHRARQTGTMMQPFNPMSSGQTTVYANTVHGENGFMTVATAHGYSAAATIDVSSMDVWPLSTFGSQEMFTLDDGGFLHPYEDGSDAMLTEWSEMQIMQGGFGHGPMGPG